MKNHLLFLLFISFFFVAKSQYSPSIKIESLLKTDTTILGQDIDCPFGDDEEISIAKITIPSGASTGWHKHHYPVFAYVLKGTLTVEIERGKFIKYPENTSFSEVIETYHNGTNKEDDYLVLIAFYLGKKGEPLSISRE